MGYIGNAPYQGSQIGSGSIQDGSVDTVDLKDGAVTLAKLAATGTKDGTTFLRGDNTFAVVAVTPTAVSDQNNTSTGAFDVPSGTTAQRPASPTVGMVRFNTTLSCLENYTPDGWAKVSVAFPTVSSVSGEIYSGYTSTLTLSGTNFGVSNCTVRFESGATTKDVSVTPSSQTSLAVSVPAEIYSLSGGSAVSVKVINSDFGVSAATSKTVISMPTGGSITTSGGYRIHTFATSGSLVVPSGFSATSGALVVAGGGGGGANMGGGGGAGGLIQWASGSLTQGTYSIIIGAGGAGGVYGSSGDVSGCASGANSSAIGNTAIGGGAGSSNYTGAALSGGSGGGGNHVSNLTGGSGTSGQGYAGGSGTGSPYCGGGGGGAGGAGSAGGNSTYGLGGVGVSIGAPINAYVCAGGGAGGEDGVSVNTGSATSQGGGRGGRSSSQATSATTYGSGGGGGCWESLVSPKSGATGGNGSGGVVAIRYPLPT